MDSLTAYQPKQVRVFDGIMNHGGSQPTDDTHGPPAMAVMKPKRSNHGDSNSVYLPGASREYGNMLYGDYMSHGLNS